MNQRFFRIALVAQPERGLASFSLRAEEVLEALGHTVFLFTPRMFPTVCADGSARLSELARFVRVQGIDCVMLADGVGADAGQVAALRGRPGSADAAGGARSGKGACASDDVCDVPIGLLCAQRDEAALTLERSQGVRFDFALYGGDDAPTCAELAAACGFVETFAPAASRVYRDTPIANDVAFDHGILCLQDITGARGEMLERVVASPQLAGLGLHSIGCDAGGAHRLEVTFAEYVYASRTSVAAVIFNEAASEDAGAAQAWGTGWTSDALVALLLADGVPVLCVGKPIEASRWRDEMRVVADEDELRCALIDAQAARMPLFRLDLKPAAAAAPGTTAGEHGGGQLALEDELGRALDSLHAHFEPAGLMRGSDESRMIVCVLGYFGMTNFGDEYILATIDARLRRERPGAAVVAVSERVGLTLRYRGIYAVSIEDKVVLDAALAHASAALVTAGLLFDQGLRWNCGVAEIASLALHSTIPGILSYVLLAAAHDTPAVFYGIGAGPLDLEDGRRLVKLAGDLGALFMPRDEDTGSLLRACGVPDSQVRVFADTAFLGTQTRMARVDAWLDEWDLAGDDVRLVAVSLRDYETCPPDFVRIAAAAFDALADANDDVRFAFCVLDDEDNEIGELVRDLMVHSDRFAVFDAENNVEAMADLLGRATVGVAMRYHCSLLLNRAGIPCVGLGYLPKVEALYEEMGCAELLLPMSASADELRAKVQQVLDERAAWSETVRAASEVLAQRSRAAWDALMEIAGSLPSRAGHVYPCAYYLRKETDMESQLRFTREREIEQRQRADDLDRQLRDIRQKIRELAQCCDDLRVEVSDVRESHSYKLGNALVRIPGAIKARFRRQRDNR